MKHTSVISNSLLIHRWKRDRVFVTWRIEPWDILGIFELAVVIECTLVGVRWSQHIEKSMNGTGVR